jgi:hypothetical protein
VSGKFELIETDSGGAHHLEGHPLREGDAVDVQLEDGSWLSGAYTWSGHRSRWPVLRIAVGRLQGGAGTIPLVLHPECILRRTPKR